MNLSGKSFQVSILELNWIERRDDPNDLCAHGKLLVKIGDEVVCDFESGTWTLSSTALYLLRSLKQNYSIGDYDSQLIPCCGHFFIADEQNKQVEILGCANGIDWTIEQLEGDKVKHKTINGTLGIIELTEYRNCVYDFVDRVEQFYKESLPKEIPKDEFDRNGYLMFWQEWERLRKA